MTIRKGVDLGASFNRLKQAFKDADEMRKGGGIDGVTSAFARLYVNVEHFVNEFDDVSEKQKPYLHDQLNWQDDKNDIPEGIFQTPGTGNYLAD